MKKTLFLTVCIMVLILCGCGSTEKQEPNNTAETNIEETSNKDSGKVVVEKELFDVTLTLPASLNTGNKTQADYDELAKEKGYKSITINEDGSLTYVMTKSQHREAMESTKKTIDEAFAKTIQDTENNIVDIKANDNYTEIKAYVSSEKLSLYDTMNNLAFMMYGNMYNSFNGTPVDNVHIQYIQQSTGNVIKEFNTSEMGKN